MPTYPLLPQLKDDGDGLSIIPGTGTWEVDATAALNHIAAQLNVTELDAQYIDIDSIPCMWARPLLFEIVLYDTDHPMHDIIVGEWRGLLTMLALKERKNFPLTTQLIKIPSDNDGKTPEFLRVLRKLMPEHKLDQNTTWENLYLILLKNRPIGITSPTTIVCTSIDYQDCISVLDVPWYEPPFLRDPIGSLNPEESQSVAGWLHKFYQDKIDPLPSSDIRGYLAEQVEAFITGLNGIPKVLPELSNISLKMDVGIFNGMDFPIAPKKYFTDKLFVINKKTAFTLDNILPTNILSSTRSNILDLDGTDITPILPIKKEMLNEFSADELNKRITFEKIPGGIKVYLNLPSEDDANGMLIDRTFEKKKDDGNKLFDSHEIVEIDHLPVFEVWPNFRTPDWKAYFTYFRKVQNTFDAKPLSTESKDCSLGENIEITKTSTFPTVMMCTYSDVNNFNDEEAGILLIAAQKSQPGAATWNIGIDFGTSGTTVYKREKAEAKPETLSFADRLLQITNSKSEDRDNVYQQFFSSRLETTPFFSLFQQHEHAETKLKLGKELDPLLDGHIYFVKDYKLKKNVVSNLKWSPEPDDRLRTRAFIKQICLQCAAEASHNNVKVINWYFSYPLAFSKDDTDEFNNICTDATKVCTEITKIQNGSITFKSESIATANFFAGEFAGFADGAVCIDIGGETSDISIWQGNKLRWQTSIRFAGRTIFLDLLRYNPDFLKIFRVSDDVIQVLKDASKSDVFYSQADTWINTWINDSTDGLKEKFGTYGGQIKDTPFVPLIALGISGLLYYIGLILNYLESKGFTSTMPNIYIGGNGSNILHWLANGDFTRDSENNEDLKKCLKDIILAASGFDPNAIFEFKITPQPKHEAAAGLVEEETPLIVTSEEFDVLAGESFSDDDEGYYEWTTALNVEHFGKDLKPIGELVQLEKFIGVFNEGLGKKLKYSLNLDPVLKNDLNSDLNDWFKKLKADPDDNRIIEPVFIKTLGKLLERKINLWN